MPMLVMLALVGSLLGLTFAWGIYRTFLVLRRSLLLPTVIVGWLFTAHLTYYVFLCLAEYLTTRSDWPTISEAGLIWEPFALLLVVLLFLCGALAVRQGRTFGIGWFKAFGVLTAETGTAITCALALHIFLYRVTDSFRGGIWDIALLLASFTQGRYLLGCFDITLLSALLLLEFVRPFSQQRPD